MTDMVKNELIKTKIPWTPYAPIGWDIKRAKFIFKSKKEINSQMQCNDRLALTLKGVIDRFEGDNIGLNPNDLRTYQIFQPNELVFKLLDLDNKKTSRVGFVHKKGIMSSAYIRVLENPNMNMRYFYYQYFDLYQRFIFNDIGQGVRATMSSSDLLNIPILIPPLETQNAIVNYLDRKTQQIQEFIAKKERLIELLEERRKIEIQKLITHGIKKDVELINTGIKWFAKIPKHWQLKKLKHFTDHVQRGSSPDYVNDNGIPVVSQAVFSAGFIDETKFKFQKNQKIESFKGRLFRNDVLVASTGGGVLGKSFLFETDGDYIADGHVTLIRDSKKRFVPAFLNYILSINFKLIEGYLGQGSTNQTELQREWFRNMLFPYPPIEEQKEIVNAIKKINNEIDRIISKAQTEIEKAKEYQESLITQVVTGQLKVLDKVNSNLEQNIELGMVAESNGVYHSKH